MYPRRTPERIYGGHSTNQRADVWRRAGRPVRYRPSTSRRGGTHVGARRLHSGYNDSVGRRPFHAPNSHARASDLPGQIEAVAGATDSDRQLMPEREESRDAEPRARSADERSAKTREARQRARSRAYPAPSATSIETRIYGVSGRHNGNRNRLTGISKLVMARDFWRQALHLQGVSTTQTSTGVLAIPRSSTRVLETFWTR